MPKNITKEEFAALLNGRERRQEITSLEAQAAKESGLVIVFGYSDDCAEFRGAIHDEVGCYDGRSIHLNQQGPLAHHDEYCECSHCGHEAAKAKAAVIEAIWGKDGYSWTYKTGIPHATFEVMDDGEKYCRGIVFNHSDLPSI